MKKLCVLGISGSIGVNVSDVVLSHREDFEIVGASVNTKIAVLEEMLSLHPSIRFVAIGDYSFAETFQKAHPDIHVFFGERGLTELIDATSCDMVVNALVGFAGLVPTVHTLERGIDCALANKESLVVGGELIREILKSGKAHLYPIDSEHVALAKLLNAHDPDVVSALYITASGGAFRDLSREELSGVTPEQALRHPSWSMGAKITVDSATMMNKGFEIIEAYHLFHFPLEKIHVLMHDESVIHSAVELKDHSIAADLGPADMRIPITYALYEERYADTEPVARLHLEDLGSLHFRPFDPERYPAVELAKEALRIGGSMPCVLNAANEEANLAFREGRLPFIKIEEIVGFTMKRHKLVMNPSLDDLIKINSWARKTALSRIEEGA